MQVGIGDHTSKHRKLGVGIGDSAVRHRRATPCYTYTIGQVRLLVNDIL